MKVMWKTGFQGIHITPHTKALPYQGPSNSISFQITIILQDVFAIDTNYLIIICSATTVISTELNRFTNHIKISAVKLNLGLFCLFQLL